MIATRTVKLYGGPFDGTRTIVSGKNAFMNNEVYLQDATDPERFVHITIKSK